MATIPDLKKLREKAFLTAPAVYKSAGINRSTLTRAEDGESIQHNTALKILKALNDLHYKDNGALEPSLIRE